MQNTNKRKLGTVYEDIAVDYLKQQGYRIVKQNYRNRFGEIDIIAEKDHLLVIVEVKFRNNDNCGDPLEAVDYRKQKRISKITLFYYMEQGYHESHPCRFDVIAIYGDGQLKHIENAFEFCG